MKRFNDNVGVEVLWSPGWLCIVLVNKQVYGLGHYSHAYCVYSDYYKYVGKWNATILSNTNNKRTNYVKLD